MHRWMRTTVLGTLLVLAACGGGSSGGHAKVTCSPSGTHLAITAQNNAFDKACLAAPAGQPLPIAVDNRDPGALSFQVVEPLQQFGQPASEYFLVKLGELTNHRRPSVSQNLEGLAQRRGHSFRGLEQHHRAIVVSERLEPGPALAGSPRQE